MRKKTTPGRGTRGTPLKKRTDAGRRRLVRRRAAASAANAGAALPLSVWSRRAFRAGQLDAREAMESVLHGELKHAPGQWKRAMNELWNRWLDRRLKGVPLTEQQYSALSAQYARGFSEAAGVRGERAVLLPTTRTVAAVVTVMNEERTLPEVLDQLERLPLAETIVVINGSTDNSYHIARSRPELTILHYPEPLGHDVGRAIGAKASSSDIVLFLDGDLPVDAEQLRPFIGEIARGKDVALNDIHRYIGVFAQRDVVTVMKEFLNRVLGREDLGASSLTAIPHALSRRAIQQIGYESLAVPPLAHARAIQLGLSFGKPISVDVITKNKVRRSLNVGVSNPVAEMIIGDHIEALHYCMSVAGSRLGFPDHSRNRQSIGGLAGAS